MPSEAHAEEQRALADLGAAFHRLAAAEAYDDAAAHEIRRRRAAVDAAAARSPYILAVLGRDVGKRTRLLNDLLGEVLVDPARQDAIGGRLRFRHGASPTYRAQYRNGEVEDFDELVPDRSGELAEEITRRRRWFEETDSSLAAIRERLEQKQRALDARAEEVASVEVELERLARRRAAAARAAKTASAERGTALTVAQKRWCTVPGFLRDRPPWWALWAWIARVLFGRRHRQALAEAAALSERAERLRSQRVAAEEKARRVNQELIARLSRRELLLAAYEEEARRCATLEEEERSLRALLGERGRELERAEAELAAFVDERQRRFGERVRALTDTRAAGGEIESLMVELEGLPAGVEVVDVGDADHALDLQRVWELVDREADGCTSAGELPRTAKRVFGGAIRSPTPEVLVARLRRARVLRATRHAAEACAVAHQALETDSARAAEASRMRIEALHKEHEAGTRRLESELARVSAEVEARAAWALSQAGNHIEWEIDRLRARWLGEVRGAETLAGLRSKLADVEVEATEAIPAAAAGARALLVSTLSGILAELAPAFAGERADDPGMKPPTWRELEFAPFPGDIGRAVRVAPSRLGAQFRPLPTTRAACETALDDRIERLRRRAVASILHLEPQAARHLQDALNEIVLSLERAQERRRQHALDAIEADADRSAETERDELWADIAAFATRLQQHERHLASRL